MAADASTAASSDHRWRRVAVLMFTVGWGANHFSPLLPVYRRALSLDAAAPALLFGVYALGLVPGLLLAGPLSDRRGRRAMVRPAATIALVVSLFLGLFGNQFITLLIGRLCYGLAAGAAMGPGAVWIAELSSGLGPGVGARRATIALSSGFGLGPFVTGALAQFLPHPTLTPFLVHATVQALALLLAWNVDETRAPTPNPGPLLRFGLPPAQMRRFMREVVPMAPWVFAFPAFAIAGLPSLLLFTTGGYPIATIGVLNLITLFSGVLVQPLTARYAPESAAKFGLAMGVGGMAVGAIALVTSPYLLVLAAPLLGTGYGICMTTGLQMIAKLAPPETRGGVTGLYYVLTYIGFGSPWLLLILVKVAPALPVVIGFGVALALTLGWLMIAGERPAKAT